MLGLLDEIGAMGREFERFLLIRLLDNLKL